MVVLGAILIWFGLSRNDGGGGTVQAGEGAGEGTVVGAGSSGDASGDSSGDSSARLDFSGGPNAAPDASPVHDAEARWSGAVPVGGDDGSIDAPGGSELEGSVEPAFESEPVYEGSPESYAYESEPEAATAEVSTQESPALRFDSAERQAPGGFQLGAAGPETQGLATMLLDAWLRADAQDLETYLTVGEGADLPASQGQLVAAFWEALAGKLDASRQRLESLRGAESITSSQLALLQAALDEPGARAVPSSAATSRIEPLAHAMKMILLNDEARTLLEAREYGRSAVAWSDLIQAEIGAPWQSNRDALLGWAKELERAQRNHRFSPRGAWPHIEQKVTAGDSLTVLRKRILRRRPDLLLCTGLIAEVNGITGYLQPGDVLRIPTDRANVIVDLDARLLMYRHGDEVVGAWQCGIGKPGHETPIGEYKIGIKQKKPAHTTKGLPYGHPDNPLGSRWLALERDGRNTSYGIHGTSDPDGVGGEVSLGCIRMRNGDVDELFEILPVGAHVILQK